MASIRKRKGADPIAPFADKIMGHMNTDHPDSVIAYARHFAGVDTALDATMTTIESDGFTVEYKETINGPKKDVWVQFETPLKSREEARTVLVKMAEDAEKALGIKVKHDNGKASHPSGKPASARAPPPSTPYWVRSMELPDAPTIILFLFLWFMAAYGAYGPPLPQTNAVFVHLEGMRTYAGGPEFYVRCLVAGLALHGVESLVCIVLGIWSRVHPVVIIFYTLSTLVFGVPSLKMMTKASITEAGRRSENGLGGLTVLDWLGVKNTSMVPDSFVEFSDDEPEVTVDELLAEGGDDEEDD
ncbi:hypothetical protein SmJEL517_g03698 [Synchytrium microbalum]|uniref:DUF2470 domain-containing protein n=1 Tax=Synchytrium microbalum TaxID=1806994 RepID=A0A507C773_9FUNG|nr:uncharacterized protein SmJEL517_g03698 [Synchytrium microbalum]TPX33335.1 hypothetical protein SmJEL517_g03698 [Synchytrium microbalum]